MELRLCFITGCHSLKTGLLKKKKPKQEEAAERTIKADAARRSLSLSPLFPVAVISSVILQPAGLQGWFHRGGCAPAVGRRQPTDGSVSGLSGGVHSEGGHFCPRSRATDRRPAPQQGSLGRGNQGAMVTSSTHFHTSESAFSACTRRGAT